MGNGPARFFNMQKITPLSKDTLMNPIKDDIAKASKQIGLTDSQADNLWQALQEILTHKSKFNLSAVLIYAGSEMVGQKAQRRKIKS